MKFLWTVRLGGIHKRGLSSNNGQTGFETEIKEKSSSETKFTRGLITNRVREYHPKAELRYPNGYAVFHLTSSLVYIRSLCGCFPTATCAIFTNFM